VFDTVIILLSESTADGTELFLMVASCKCDTRKNVEALSFFKCAFAVVVILQKSRDKAEK
jgi:hypothetical protein